MTHRCPDYEPCVACAQQEAFEDGMLRGIAAYEGVMGMARVIGARERAKPRAPDPDLYPCQRRHPADGRIRCNLVNDHDGPHQRISSLGRGIHTWSRDA